MANIDDMIDQVNKPDSPKAGSKRISVDSLTDGEKEGLREQGYDVDGSDFVDLELESHSQVDLEAERRRKAAEELSSVTKAVEKAESASVVTDAPREPSGFEAKMKDLEETIRKKDEIIESVPAHCNRCGWPTGEKVVIEPSQEDVKDFLRAVLGGEVYKKEYRLFGEQVAVTFRTRTGEEENTIRRVIRQMVREGEIMQQLDMLSEVRRCNFAFAVVCYTTSQTTLDFSSGTTADKQETEAFRKHLLMEEVERRINKLPSQLIAVLMRKFDEFSELVDNLMSKVNDVGFWTGTES